MFLCLGRNISFSRVPWTAGLSDQTPLYWDNRIKVPAVESLMKTVYVCIFGIMKLSESEYGGLIIRRDYFSIQGTN